MAYRSQLLSQSGLSPELTSQFERDWNAANDAYVSAVNAGNPDDFAQSVYLDPVRQKWSIIASSPQLVQNKGQFDKFNQEFNAANDLFQKRIVDSGNVNDSANAQDSIVPTLKKWSVEAALPTSAPLSDSEKNKIAKWPQQDIDEFRQMSEAQRQFKLAAYNPNQTDEGKTALLSEADKYAQAAEAIKEKNKDLGKVDNQDSQDFPTADTPEEVAALPYGSKYWSHGHLFQSFSPTRAMGTITIGDKVVSSPAPAAPQATPARWSLFENSAPEPSADFANFADKPEQSPAVINPSWQFTPQGSVAIPEQFAPAKRVRVVDKNGKTGTIPESQLEDALKMGYKRVE